jgi:hypothetical protein
MRTEAEPGAVARSWEKWGGHQSLQRVLAL